jgi:oxygen-independent coproporphyrinogen III oxidase
MLESTDTTAAAGTEVGSYFVANYPPFSVWTPEAVRTEALSALGQRVPRHLGLETQAELRNPTRVPLGLYLHIPFCRKRCHFCYFRVYTNKNAQEVESYLDLLAREWELYGSCDALAGRDLDFVYFGGGTPSFLSTQQLESLVKRLTARTPWTKAEEITFECEPGTLSEAKLSAIQQMGVTRLSLGVENFDDRILELNGRAHRSPEIGKSYDFARKLGFPQINIDLIAGMLGETDDNWAKCIERTLALDPDSVTIYQMELPFNTTISADKLKGLGQFSEEVASWAAKRRWVGEAFAALEAAGYTIGSAYTAVKDPSRTKFVYRDRLWQGADLVGLGVASFGHVNRVHMQNLDTWEKYSAAIDRGELPLGRAYRPTDEERLIREFVLQLKRGWISAAYFRDAYNADVMMKFRDAIDSLEGDGCLKLRTRERLELTRDGLLRVDTLLPRFFLPQHRNVRYT